MRLVSSLLIVFLAFASQSCTCSLGTSKRSPVRIGINAWPGYEFLSLAHTKGFFSELGLDTELVEFSSLADARRSIEKNQVDVIGTTVFELVLARHNSSNRVQAFYVPDFSNGGDLIVATSGIEKMADLKGKAVGVEVGSVSLYALFRSLQLNGMTASDIEVVPTSQDGMVEDFQSGRIQAGVTYPPFSLKMLKSPGSQVLFSSKEIPEEIVDVFVASSLFLSERRDDAKIIVEGFKRAVEYANKPGSDGMAIMAAREKITEEEFRKVLAEDIALVPFEDQNSHYFRGGQLQRIAHQVEAMLMETGQIRGAARTDDIAVWIF